MIKVGIIGGAGYTAGELLRLLINHPRADIRWVHSTSNAGARLADVHTSLEGDTELRFSDVHPLDDVDVVFLCSGHGQSTAFWEENSRPEGLRVVDLAQDFRDEHDGYVYGLPEYCRQRIAGASLVANPGCFATAIQLALMPLAANGLLTEEVNITAVTGSTGAGVKPGATTHFSWRTDNLSVYKPFTHQHLAEIERTLESLQSGRRPSLTFIPVRGDFARGIFAMCVVKCAEDPEKIKALYDDFYASAVFTHRAERPIDLKQVVNTNKALIHLDFHDGHILVTSAIDNLLKGASGQAVQNMNLMFGLPEDCGLRLKASTF